MCVASARAAPGQAAEPCSPRCPPAGLCQPRLRACSLCWGHGEHTGAPSWSERPHWLPLRFLRREVAQRNSPMLCVTQAVPAACEVLVAVAQHDSPEFRRQSQEYSQVSPAAPRPAPRGSCSDLFSLCEPSVAGVVAAVSRGGRWSSMNHRPCRAPCPEQGALPRAVSPQALRSAGWAVSLLDLASVDHFDIIEKLSEDTYILTQVRSPRPLHLSLSRAQLSPVGREGGWW